MRRLDGIDGQEFKQTQGESKGQGSLACCSPWGCKVRHNLATEQHVASCVHMCVISPWLPLRKIYVTTFRVHIHNPGKFLHLNILDLIISAETLLPSKGIFIGSRDEDFMSLGDSVQPLLFISLLLCAERKPQ